MAVNLVNNKFDKITPLGDTVLVTGMNFKERITTGGIVLLGDDGKTSGIRPRWGQVYAVGPEQKDVRVGEWIFVLHGRWTRGIEIEDAAGKHTVRKVDPKDIILSSDERLNDDTFSDAIQSQAKTL